MDWMVIIHTFGLINAIILRFKNSKRGPTFLCQKAANDVKIILPPTEKYSGPYWELYYYRMSDS